MYCLCVSLNLGNNANVSASLKNLKHCVDDNLDIDDPQLCKLNKDKTNIIYVALPYSATVKLLYLQIDDSYQPFIPPEEHLKFQTILFCSTHLFLLSMPLLPLKRVTVVLYGTSHYNKLPSPNSV